jgi:hypothetical protein
VFLEKELTINLIRPKIYLVHESVFFVTCLEVHLGALSITGLSQCRDPLGWKMKNHRSSSKAFMYYEDEIIALHPFTNKVVKSWMWIITIQR